MIQDTVLYTIPQWFVFAAIIASVYGWVEKKKVFRLLGVILFFFLGIFSLYALLTGSFSFREYLTPSEIINQEMEEEFFEELPFSARLFPAYIAFLISGALAVPTFFLQLKNWKGRNLLLILTAFAGIAGFFVIVDALKNF
jgi:predicted membrane channel-forming protein YqfA (hemolysin III family)